MFGSKSAKGGQSHTPRLALLIWFLRDLVAFTFILTLPAVITARLGIAEEVAKFATPVLAQYFTTPLHLLGFNMCNKPTASLAQQLADIKPGFFSTVAARQMRIIPPYSIGGVLNGRLLSTAPLLLGLSKKQQ